MSSQPSSVVLPVISALRLLAVAPRCHISSLVESSSHGHRLRGLPGIDDKVESETPVFLALTLPSSVHQQLCPVGAVVVCANNRVKLRVLYRMLLGESATGVIYI
jgi:hypothetical protein